MTSLSPQLSECESAVEEVERELRAHNLHLEALQGTTERDAATIAHLTASKEELEEEMNEREKNIKYLENIVQEVRMWHIMTHVHACYMHTSMGRVL